ncbi:PREDICTED: nucleolar complex protein 2 homolog [Ceratosolen solmsi marchali]|uniref:Nucleolar complex protein 2 homolog n=1 Tax=Ceratosolen solmsi marchali TaxID=326594 RepID=A0AAJ6YHU4_9HYME|nr:PREDICTED: nucleolar complex protein 2 homolog [Ceratosolen solmsi marchali]
MKLKKGKAVEKMAKKHVARKKKKNAANVNVDEFLNLDFGNLGLADGQNGNSIHNKSSKNHMDDSEDSDLDEFQHKKSLWNLKDTDPEFFNYLKKNDAQLLDFNVDDEIDENENKDDSKHVPDYELQVPSDESDYETNKDRPEFSGDKTKVTLKLLKIWENEIQNDKSAASIKRLVDAFHGALETVSDSDKRTTQYKVEGGAIFNGIMQLCILYLPEAFGKFLKIQSETPIEAHKSKRFPKIKGLIKAYLHDLVKVLESVSSGDIIVLLLKHLHQMLPYSQSFSSLRKPLLRLLIKYWSTADEETVRVVAFLCIIKIATSQPFLIGNLQKTMYIKYVENAKFVSPSTLPGINFMRQSLVELYLIDCNFSYYNAFLYVRQLAIHLRKALTLKKKENFQAVYNWQFINSLRFWSELIALADKKTLLHNLEYPLIQITIGVIKLIPISRYFPLRFHCVKMLIKISKEAGTFIPSLPFITEVLEIYDFNRKHKVVSMKPMSLMCMLKVSKSQAQENGYKDAIIENVYELLLESAAKDSTEIYFPDMYIFCVIQIKEFLKKCQVGKYCRKIKQLLDKIEEGRKFIETERAKRVFDLSNMKEIEIWERSIKDAGTPVTKFYDTWLKFHESQQIKLLTQHEEVADFKVPTIKKTKRSNKQKNSEEDSDLEVPVEQMNKRLKKSAKSRKKLKTKNDENMKISTNDADIVEDIKDSDWE